MDKDIEQLIRALVRAEVAPLVSQLMSVINSRIDSSDGSALISAPAKRERDAVRAETRRRDRLLAELAAVEDRVVRLAKKRFPQWKSRP